MLYLFFDLSFMFDIVIFAVLALLTIVAIKHKYVFVVVGLILSALLITTTAFSVVNLENYYSAQGGIIGTIEGLYKPNNTATVTDLTFDFTNMTLLETGEVNTYEAKVKTDASLKLSDTTYVIEVNGSPCQTVEYSDNYVIADYSYVFYDTDMQVLIEDTLHIRFVFHENQSILYLETNGGSVCAKKWTYYFNVNGFVVNIKPVDSVYIPSAVVPKETVTVKLMVEGALYDTYTLLKGSTYTLPTITTNSYQYTYWFDSTYTKLYDSSIILTEDLTIYTKEYFQVLFYVDNELVNTVGYHYLDEITYKYGNSGGVVSPLSGELETRIFSHWEDINGNTVTVCTQDIALYAVFDIIDSGDEPKPPSIVT